MTRMDDDLPRVRILPCAPSNVIYPKTFDSSKRAVYSGRRSSLRFVQGASGRAAIQRLKSTEGQELVGAVGSSSARRKATMALQLDLLRDRRLTFRRHFDCS